MLQSTNPLLAAVATVLGNIAGELSTVEADKDNGLLALYSLAMELAQTCSGAEVPTEIRAAAILPRDWIDRLLDTTAVFDAATITRLRKWSTWSAELLDSWKTGSPLAAMPSDWSASSAPAPQSSVPVANTEVIEAQRAAPKEEPLLTLNADSDRELLAEFINESQEHLQNIEQGVLVLEENPADADTLNSIFRAFHTFKGGAGFLNLTAIKDLAHELESLLDAARQNRLEVSSQVINVILEGGDRLTEFVTQITKRINGGGVAEEPILVPTLSLIERVKAILSEPEAAGVLPGSHVEIGVTENIPAAPPFFVPTEVPVCHAEEAFRKGQGSLADAEVIPLPAAVPKQEGATVKPSSGASAGDSAAAFVKVDTLKLDSLIEIVGELVIAQSMVVQDHGVRDIVSQELTRNLAQLRRTTNDLQRTAMSLRMVPIRSSFQKMTRLVRDLAAKQKKQVRLVMNGEDTELDRTIVGELSDPLIHMIRNSVDHGIERSEARVARGKPAEGVIELSAFHQGGSIIIQIRDDGNGLNKDRILAKAIEKGLVKPDALLPDSEIFSLIFAAGFSTAEAITDISGRGVGMDVVRRNIENLRGKIDITSEAGVGTTFTISLPLTLAIIDGLIVGVGPERYIIPTLSVRESFRPAQEMLSTVYGRGEMVNVRGRLTPLLRLNRHFNIEGRVTDPTQGIVVVVESGEARRCLMVDDLLGKQEVVIKNLGEQFQRNGALAGGAILGDGRVGLILNVDALVNLNEHGMEIAA